MDEWTENELYAAHIEVARLQAQVSELAPYALLGTGVVTGQYRLHVTGYTRPDPRAEQMMARLLAGEFGGAS